MLTYKVKDDGRNVKVTHHNWLFLVAPMRDTAMPLGGGKSISYIGATQATLVELSLLECGRETSESEVEGALTKHSTSCVPPGWLDGVLQPLLSGTLRLCRLRSGKGTRSFSVI